jgi:hypothetical protein
VFGYAIAQIIVDDTFEITERLLTIWDGRFNCRWE